MEHPLWVKRTFVNATLAASIGLTACGGGGGDSAGTSDITPPSTIATVSGIVADGYLVNATVCLDLDLSKTCDPGEPSAVSASGGTYSFQATHPQIDSSPVVAEIIAGITVDQDDQTAPVTKKYTLSAPAGKGAFVSPLSTMVHAQMETSGKTAEQIENEILVSMGQDPAVVSLFDDYVAQKVDANNPPATQASYLNLHQVAQVTAVTIANNIETVEAAISSGDIDVDLTTELDSVITIIVQGIIEKLAVIAAEVENAASFDASAIAAAADTSVDTATIEDQVAVVEATTNSVATSDVQTLFTSGISWLWAHFETWSSALERSLITYDATTGKLSEPMESYFASNTLGWSPVTDSIDNFILQGDGTWLGTTDSWGGSPVLFDNTTGTATINSNWGAEAISNIKTSDLEGLNIKQFVANKLQDLARYIDSSAVFSAGSVAYSMNITSLEDSYTVWISDWCGGAGPWFVNGNCNTVMDNTANPIAPANSLTDLLNSTAWVDPGDGSSPPQLPDDLGSYTNQDGVRTSFYFELVQGATSSSGAVNYYIFGANPTWEKIGAGTWEMVTVNGVELLMVDHPDGLMSQYLHIANDLDSPEMNTFFAIQDGAVREGNHWPANITEYTAESILANQQAQEEISAAFLDASIINAVPSGELPCATSSDWNPLINAPLVTYSFADFEAVVTTCGGAIAVDANTLTGGGASQTYNLDDGTTITFSSDNTGNYTENGQPASSFNWSIDLATNYITLENPGSFRDILAAIALDSSTTPATLTFKGYIEEVGRSDMVTNQGSDGEIAHLNTI